MNRPAVIFDLGGVVVRWDPAAAVRDILTPEQWASAAHQLDFPALNAQADAGRPYRELVEQVAARHASAPALIAAYRHYLRHVARSFPGPVPGTAAVVEELLAVGVRVLGLTNWSAETVHHGIAAAPIIERFEGLVVSGREGVCKPDPLLYLTLCDRFGVAPGDAVYVDDRTENVEAAERLGMAGLVFTDAATLRRDLAAAGVLTAGPAGT